MQKLLNWLPWNFQGWFVIIKGSNEILGAFREGILLPAAIFLFDCQQDYAKLLSRFEWNFQGWFVIILGPNQEILWAIKEYITSANEHTCIAIWFSSGLLKTSHRMFMKSLEMASPIHLYIANHKMRCEMSCFAELCSFRVFLAFIFLILYLG